MFAAFLNSRIPSILSALAFAGCCLVFCNVLSGVRESAQLSPPVIRSLSIWGLLALACMLVFCLCLAKVTRYQRSLPDKRLHLPDSR